MATANENKTAALLDSIERKIHLLKNEYDRYFLGLERREPMKEREALERMFREIARNPIRNTALNFRYQGLKATFTAYHQYWLRSIKQIEEGTFRRDQFRLKVKQADEEDLLERKRLEDLKQKEEEAREEARARTAEEVRRRKDTVEDPNRLKHLYQDFLDKRKQCNERVDNVQYEGMLEFMRTQTRSIKDKYQCSAVEFQVVVDGGKTKLKAIPVK